jgi:single-stranded DNA-binding protein
MRIEGELRSREYETAGGTKVRTYEIVASSIHNLRPGQRNNAQETESEENPATSHDDTSL